MTQISPLCVWRSKRLSRGLMIFFHLSTKTSHSYIYVVCVEATSVSHCHTVKTICSFVRKSCVLDTAYIENHVGFQKVIVKKVQALHKLYNSIVMTSDTVVTSNALPQKGFKIAVMQLQGHVVYIICGSGWSFQILRLVHDCSSYAWVSSDSRVGRQTHISPHPTSSSVLRHLSAMCHQRLTGSLPAVSRSVFDFCHYTICSMQQLPLQPSRCFFTQICLVP